MDSDVQKYFKPSEFKHEKPTYLAYATDTCFIGQYCVFYRRWSGRTEPNSP